MSEKILGLQTMEKDFLNYANKFYEYHNQNNIEKANDYAKKMNSMLTSLINEESYIDFCDKILLSKNYIAIIWVCGICIDYNYRKEDAINILKELSINEDEIISRDANMLLFVKTHTPT